MKSLSAIAKELDVSVATVSYVYNDKWRENRIHPDLAERVRRKLEQERAAPNVLGRQLQSGRTQTMGVLLPYLDQPYFLHLLAGIEDPLFEADYMLVLGNAHWQREGRQLKLVQRMLEHRVDALLISPRPAPDLTTFLSTARDTPLIFVDNYLPECPAGRVLSDNHWGAREAVRAMLARKRQRILFIGGDSAVAVLVQRYTGYCDALAEAGIEHAKELTLWRSDGEQTTLDTLRGLLSGHDRPDAIFATSFFHFLPVLRILEELQLNHPDDVLLAGFDEPMEHWPQTTVQSVIRQPLWTITQSANEIGAAAVEQALAAINGADVTEKQQLIKPVLTWQV